MQSKKYMVVVQVHQDKLTEYGKFSHEISLIYDSFYKECRSILYKYGFLDIDCQGTIIAINDNCDATNSYTCIIKGFNNSWVKEFIRGIRISKIEDNSDASIFLDKSDRSQYSQILIKFLDNYEL